VRVRWKDFDGRWLFVTFGVLVLAAIEIHTAIQFSNAAPTERTTIAHNVMIHRRYFFLIPTYSCSYDFRVDDRSFSGKGVCPELTDYDSIKGEFSNSVRNLPMPDATVYFDPADPSIHSLTDFSARSENEYRNAIGWVGLGVVFTLPFILLMALGATKGKKGDKIYVDAMGTVIDPDGVDFDSGFGGMPVGGRSDDAADAAAQERAERGANFAASDSLRELYIDVIKHIHPDLALNEADRILRERLTKDANVAFERGDDAALRRALEDYKEEAASINSPLAR